jgi:hypothetical protein
MNNNRSNLVARVTINGTATSMTDPNVVYTHKQKLNYHNMNPETGMVTPQQKGASAGQFSWKETFTNEATGMTWHLTGRAMLVMKADGTYSVDKDTFKLTCSE